MSESTAAFKLLVWLWMHMKFHFLLHLFCPSSCTLHITKHTSVTHWKPINRISAVCNTIGFQFVTLSLVASAVFSHNNLRYW